MSVKNHLLSFTRKFLSAGGFAVTCIGVYVVSLQTKHGYDAKLIPVYVMIGFGLLALLIGVFWSLSHSMRSKIYQRRGQERNIQIFTIERRPSSFPPSYEESQSQVCPSNPPEAMVSVGRADMFLAPPLYSQDSSEVPDCRWSWENPPQYSLVVQTPHRQVDAGELRRDLSSN